MKLRPIIRGLVGYIPGLLDILKNRKEHTGTIKAEYCYSVWLRHLYYLKRNGFANFKSIAELGPGASLGIGLASLITGAEKYYAFDLIKHTEISYNVKILGELVDLFKLGKDLPSEKDFPKLEPKLDSYSVNSFDFDKIFIDNYLNKSRISKIENAVLSINSVNKNEIKIEYKVPWYDAALEQPVDLIISQAVLEHIDNLEFSIDKMSSLLKKGGIMSHVIDYSAHETHEIWNGHWSYSSELWHIILKGRSYSLNRKPHSYYLQLFEKYNLSIVYMQPTYRFDGIQPHEITKKSVINYQNSDYNISSCYFILQKK